MPDVIVQNIICFQTQEQLATLNSIAGLLKGVLIDLHTQNFVHAKTLLQECCVHACNCVCNLLSPVRYKAEW